jgi:hypothetical protein
MVVSNALERDPAKVTIKADVSYGIQAGTKGLRKL